MTRNDFQPKSIQTVVPLARDIPEYRQARMSGRKYAGPMININPYWHQSSSLPDLTDQRDTIKIRGQRHVESTDQTAKRAEVAKLAAVDEIEKLVFSEEEGNLSQVIKKKEAELEQLRQKTALQKNQLEKIGHASRASRATIKNLRQQLGNIEMGPATKETMDDLKDRITEKEQEEQLLSEQAEELLKDADAEKRLEEEIAAYRGQVRELKIQQDRLEKLVLREEQQLKTLVSRLREKTLENVSKESKIKELQKLLDETMNEAFTQPKAVDKFVRANGPDALENAISLSQEPNAINGIVKDSENKLVGGSIVIVKDVAGHNLRALQSNQLGQFVLTTPLQNGTYYIEATKSGLTFPVVEVELTGKPVAPVVLTSNEPTS